MSVATRRQGIATRLDDLVNKWDDISGTNGDYDSASPPIEDPHAETHLAAIEFHLYGLERLLLDVQADISGGGSAIGRTKAT